MSCRPGTMRQPRPDFRPATQRIDVRSRRRTRQRLISFLAVWATVSLSWSAPSAQADDFKPLRSFLAYPKPRPFKNRPHIPVYMIPMTALEPSRSVPARTWISPYCTTWTDGEELCEKSDPLRKSAAADARCRPVQSAHDVTTRPKIEGVSCLSADLKALEQVCHRSMLYDPGIPVPYVKSLSRRQRIGGVFTEENWVWRAGRWDNAPGWNAEMGSTRQHLIDRGLLRADVPDLRTFYCVEGYSKGTAWRSMADGAALWRSPSEQ